MTSPENHEATVRFFAEHGRFGLEHVRLFLQGQMPAVDRATRGGAAGRARPRRAEPRRPRRHAARAAPAPSCLDEMRERGVETLFYFQVDNPLVEIADPAFLGAHRQAERRDVVQGRRKRDPDEKVGVVAERRRPPARDRVLRPARASWPSRASPTASWRSGPGSIAIHVFEREFIERLAAAAGCRSTGRVKKVPYVDEPGQPVEPAEPNAVKFEQFIFDALPLAERSLVSRPTGPPSSSRSRTRRAPTRRRPCASG